MKGIERNPDVTIDNKPLNPGRVKDLSQIELLQCILLELKVHSIYLYQLPIVLNEGTNYKDEPEILREELLHEK